MTGLMVAGICLWTLALAIVVQRQRVLDRRIRRLAARQYVHLRMSRPYRHVHVVDATGAPRVQHVAPRPLQRAGG